MQEVEMRDPCQLVVLCGFIGIGILFPLLPSFRGVNVPPHRYDFLPACLHLPLSRTALIKDWPPLPDKVGWKIFVLARELFFGCLAVGGQQLGSLPSHALVSSYSERSSYSLEVLFYYFLK